MSRLSGWWLRLRRAFGRRAFDQQVAEEMRQHLEREAADYVAAGEDPATARRRAALEFGHVDSIKEDVRDRRLGVWFEQAWQDLRFAARLLRKSPGFTLIAVATLAIGIGANTAIFSAVDAVLLRPQPYPEAERLVKVFETVPSGGRNPVSGASFQDWFKHQTQFEALAIYANDQLDLTGGERPEKINALSVSADFNRVLRVAPLLGRGFLPEDDAVGGQNNVVILTEKYWRSRYAGASDALGQKLILDGVPRTIIGIMPDDAWFQRHVAIYVPYVLVPNSYLTNHDVNRAQVLGRLGPGATLASARTELNSVKKSLEGTYPEYKYTWGVGVQPMQQILGEESKPVLMLLLAAVALVLLIACANVANLLLARASMRQREIALRAALGASGRRIVRQVITESLLLSLLGGVAGIVLAIWSVEFLRTLSARLLPATMEPQIDGRVLLFSLLASCGTGFLFGVFPALKVRRTDINHSLKSGTAGTTDGARNRSQSTLVVVEVALTAVLLVTSGLLLRGMVSTVTADPGIRSNNVLMFDLTMPYNDTYAGPARRMTFLDQVLQEIRSLPGVESAATTDDLPYGDNGQGYFFSIEEQPETRQARSGRIKYVSPGYFETVGATMVRGRPITADDNRENSPRVLVVNETLATTLFGNEDPLGRRLNVNEKPWEIVGVVADMRIDERHTKPKPMFFAPHWHFPWGSSFLVRTKGDPAAATNTIVAAVHRHDPNLPVAGIRTLEVEMAESLGPQKLILNLVGIFAAAALLLATIGLYGVMSYSVACRQRELSIRAALGAFRSHIIRMVLGQGVCLMALGLGVGLVAAFGAAHILANRMAGISGRDPLVFAGTTLVLAVVTIIACALPAWRAARANPIAALRSE